MTSPLAIFAMQNTRTSSTSALVSFCFSFLRFFFCWRLKKKNRENAKLVKQYPFRRSLSSLRRLPENRSDGGAAERRLQLPPEVLSAALPSWLPVTAPGTAVSSPKLRDRLYQSSRFSRQRLRFLFSVFSFFSPSFTSYSANVAARLAS